MGVCVRDVEAAWEGGGGGRILINRRGVNLIWKEGCKGEGTNVSGRVVGAVSMM